MSARLSTPIPRACSGAMYAAVPTTAPAKVIGEAAGDDACSTPGEAASDSLAKPKSSTLTPPSGRIFTLAGLRSRWTMPFSCAAASAAAICAPSEMASLAFSGPRRIRSARVSPSTYSATMYDRPLQ
jgi:hypothetical protein